MGIPDTDWLADAVHGIAVRWYLGIHAVLHVSTSMTALLCCVSYSKVNHYAVLLASRLLIDMIHMIELLPLIIQLLLSMEDICRTC